MMRSGRPEILAERFDAAAYLIDHPDVAAAGMDPWQHYRDFGWREGRKFRLLSSKRDPLVAIRSDLPASRGIHRDPVWDR
jgi:hypothetical protein